MHDMGIVYCPPAGGGRPSRSCWALRTSSCSNALQALGEDLICSTGSPCRRKHTHARPRPNTHTHTHTCIRGLSPQDLACAPHAPTRVLRAREATTRAHAQTCRRSPAMRSSAPWPLSASRERSGIRRSHTGTQVRSRFGSHVRMCICISLYASEGVHHQSAHARANIRMCFHGWRLMPTDTHMPRQHAHPAHLRTRRYAHPPATRSGGPRG